MTPAESVVAPAGNPQTQANPAKPQGQPVPPPLGRRPDRKAILLGLDLGTNKCCLIAGSPESSDIATAKIVPTVVGYVKPGIINGIIPGNADVVFGEEALKNRLHVNLVHPLADGVIAHVEATRDLMRHMRRIIDSAGNSEIRAVIGVPANAPQDARDNVRRAVTGVFDRVLLVPEPFLAALGVRDDARVGQSNYVDPVNNSLFIDIGAGTTDLCLVQGYFPTADDQVSFAVAGDAIDQQMLDSINQIYPDSGLSRHKIREVKEQHAYVGASRKPIDVKVIIGGKARSLELGDVIGNACNQLFERVYESVKRLVARAASDSIEQLLQNIIITGGGSQIRGIDTELQKRLVADGYENPKVRLAGQDYQRYVALGGLKAARAAREHQWQFVLD